MPSRRMLILTEGFSNPVTAKTAASLLRYCGDEVVAILDRHHAGRRAADLLGVGADVPVVASVGDAESADTLVVGTAPTGGKLPDLWRPILAEAIRHGMHIVSGLHDFVADDPELSSLARHHDVTLSDVRRNDESAVASGQLLGKEPLRIHTVGNDCSVGKMLTAIEIDRELSRRGIRSKFLATGQTGIMIAGEGVPIDCVVADFVSGAAEQLVRRSDDRDVLVIEGQGSLAHPMYSSVTLGLLHGCQPHGLIMCYEAGRAECGGIAGRTLRQPSELCDVYESLAALVQPARVIGVSINGRRLSQEQADEERKRVSDQTGLPACDVLRDGPEPLADAVEALHRSRTW